jgi:hypothetical protein
MTKLISVKRYAVRLPEFVEAMKGMKAKLVHVDPLLKPVFLALRECLTLSP